MVSYCKLALGDVPLTLILLRLNKIMKSTSREK